jgi:hypothetical protein
MTTPRHAPKHQRAVTTPRASRATSSSRPSKVGRSLVRASMAPGTVVAAQVLTVARHPILSAPGSATSDEATPKACQPVFLSRLPDRVARPLFDRDRLQRRAGSSKWHADGTFDHGCSCRTGIAAAGSPRSGRLVPARGSPAGTRLAEGDRRSGLALAWPGAAVPMRGRGEPARDCVRGSPREGPGSEVERRCAKRHAAGQQQPIGAADVHRFLGWCGSPRPVVRRLGFTVAVRGPPPSMGRDPPLRHATQPQHALGRPALKSAHKGG